MTENLKRMIRLAEEIFAVKNDPDQLDVSEQVLEQLAQIHPATVSEENDGNGPVAWLLIIPTTAELMNRFLHLEISEKELFAMTPLHIPYQAIYLCSALVLEEYRRKGITMELALKAIKQVQKDHPIETLFVWSFTEEGDLTAESIAAKTNLPVRNRSLSPIIKLP